MKSFFRRIKVTMVYVSYYCSNFIDYVLDDDFLIQ